MRIQPLLFVTMFMLIFLGCAASQPVFEPLGDVDQGCIPATTRQHLFQVRLQANSVGKDHVSIVNGCRVGRGGHVAMGIDADAHQDGQVDVLAAHLFHHVAHDVGRGYNLELLPGIQ